MARHRLINCEFINASSFKINVSNKAKLLYLMMIGSADDRGFVDTTKDLINALTDNEKEFNNTVSLELLENTYNTALDELVEKGYLYEFKDNHSNKVYLIRHWFYHNKLIKGLWTNYRNFLEMVYLDNNEYVRGKKPLKEDNIKETKQNKTKLNENNVSVDDWDKLFEKEDKKTQDEDELPY